MVVTSRQVFNDPEFQSRYAGASRLGRLQVFIKGKETNDYPFLHPGAQTLRALRPRRQLLPLVPITAASQGFTACATMAGKMRMVIKRKPSAREEDRLGSMTDAAHRAPVVHAQPSEAAV